MANTVFSSLDWPKSLLNPVSNEQCKLLLRFHYTKISFIWSGKFLRGIDVFSYS